jgi:hypothetical protein
VLFTKNKEVCQVYEKLFNVTSGMILINILVIMIIEKYIMNKCRTYYGENLFQDNIYTLHGKKYEEISCRLYRNVYNTNVIEFDYYHTLD